MARFQVFQFGEGAGPVGFQEPREAAVREQLSGGLAGGAVVAFVVGIGYALDGVAADGARLAESAVDAHAIPERGDFRGEFLRGFRAEAVNPFGKNILSGAVQGFDLVFREPAGEF